jgi:hypothetical protein
MNSEDVMPMHTEFPVWVREFELSEDINAREKCWAGIVSFIGDPDRDDIENLIRLAFDTRQKASSTFLKEFRAALHDANPEGVVPGNDREMQVLAGCCLVVLLGNGDAGLADLVALAITTTSAGGGRKHKLPMEIEGLAESALIRLSESNSQRPDLAKYSSTAIPKFGLEDAIAKVTAQPDAAGITAAFTLAATAISTALKAITTKQNTTINDVNTFIKQQDEELQMLWWLTGGRSIDENCPFDKVEQKVQPLIFAKELAGHTEVSPGPASIKGLLSRAGLRDAGQLKLHQVINAAKAEWLLSLVEDIEPSPVTQPIHFAIKRQLETGSGEKWIANWAATTGLDAEISFTPLELGNLFYRERLLQLFSGE